MIARVLTFGLTPPHPPAGWAVATLSLLGLGAHLANGIPDIDADRASDSQGIVGRLGERTSANLAVPALLAAALAVGSILAATASGGRRLFPVVMLLALVDTLLLSLNVGIIVGG